MGVELSNSCFAFSGRGRLRPNDREMNSGPKSNQAFFYHLPSKLTEMLAQVTIEVKLRLFPICDGEAPPSRTRRAMLNQALQTFGLPTDSLQKGLFRESSSKHVDPQNILCG